MGRGMTKKLPLAHKKELHELNLNYRSNSERLRKEAKVEGYASFAGAVGAFVTMVWFFNPQGVEASIGSFGLTIAFCAIPFGAWAYFAPPSENPSRGENYVLNSTRKRLKELGYNPYFFEKSVAFIDSKEFLKVYSDASYESATDSKPIRQSKERHNAPVTIHGSAKTYKVFVDDNFNFMNEDEGYILGEYSSEEEAVIACKRVIDDFLNHNLTAGSSSEEVCDKWSSFGEDPWLQEGDFSSLKYAKTRSKEIIDGLKQLG